MNIFITGTDTDVGKTVITAGIADTIQNLGFSAGVLKALQSGAEMLSDRLVSPDLEFVKSVNSEVYTKYSYILKEPVAPSLAAEIEEIDINPEKIKQDFIEMAKTLDVVIVEGAGGFLAPACKNFSMRDMAKLLDLPIVIVARPDLGTINHTLLTIEAAKNKNIDILGIIISGYPKDTNDIAIKNAPRMIEELSGEKIIGIIPKINKLSENPSEIRGLFSKYLSADFIKNLQNKA